jgi:hypothetical protein
MRQIFFVFTALLALQSPLTFAFDHTHSQWSSVLSSYQDGEGKIRYKALKADSAKPGHVFATFLNEIQKVSFAQFEGWTPNQKKAFLINAYNALTLKLIIDNYPTVSIKKIGGLFTKPWAIEFFSLLDGKIKSLDPIEHEWLRPVYKDFRIHAAVNCASISCPALRHSAFVADQLDRQLDEQMTTWLADNSRNQFDVAAGKVKLSKIFSWYKADFESWGGGTLAVVAKFAPKTVRPELIKSAQVEFLDYNWDLNEAK